MRRLSDGLVLLKYLKSRMHPTTQHARAVQRLQRRVIAGEVPVDMDWPHALAFAANARIADHDDWRLPSAKELQSIVDYERSAAAKDSARKSCAIDTVFAVTNPESYFWTSTTYLDNRGPDGPRPCRGVCVLRMQTRILLATEARWTATRTQRQRSIAPHRWSRS